MTLKGEGGCDHGSRFRRLVLVDEYERALRRIFDNVIAGDDPSTWPPLAGIEPLFVHHTIAQLLKKKGVRFGPDEKMPEFLCEGISDGLVGLGVDYLVEGRKRFTYPFSVMATVAAIAITFLSSDSSDRRAKLDDMNRWGERETVHFFAGMSKCSCLEVECCNHGRPDIPVGGVFWSYLNVFDSVLANELGDGDVDHESSAVLRAYSKAQKMARERLKREAHRLDGMVEVKSSGDPVTDEDVEMCFLSLGTNFVLADTRHSRLMAGAVAIALTYQNTEDPARHRKGQDLLVGGPCEWTRFFADRIPCSCLAERKKTEKKLQRMSVCWNCGTRKKRRELLACSGCNLVYYCNAECQAAAWPEHKVVCETCKNKGISVLLLTQPPLSRSE